MRIVKPFLNKPMSDYKQDIGTQDEEKKVVPMEEEKKVDPMEEMKEYVTETLKQVQKEKHKDTVIAILTAADWRREMLEDPQNKQDIIAVLEKPWLDYMKLGKMSRKLSHLKDDQIVDVYDAAIGIAMDLVGFSQKKRKKMENSSSFTKRKQTIEDLQTAIPAPSSFAKCHGKGSWVELINGDDVPLVCYRKIEKDNPTPIMLLCPVFSDFLSDSLSISVSSKHCQFAEEILASMCGSFENEAQRMVAFHNIFKRFTGSKFHRLKHTKSETDGTLTNRIGDMYCNLEVKIEKGNGGGDPYMQNIAYYFHFLDTEKSSPALLLELCGSSFGISGIINTGDRVICEPISRRYDLFYVPHSFFMVEIARLFGALEIALNKLYNFPIIPPSIFPFFRSFSLNSKVYNIEYTQRLKDLTYLAKCGENLMVVKFCTRYGSEVHRHCAENGISPPMYAIFDLNPAYKVVIMEYWNLRDIDEGDKDLVKVQGTIILDTLRNSGFVHGDMRPPNLKVNKDNGKLVLLDFDWAGRDSQDSYPPFMNEEIPWPEGAGSGLTLQFKHDESWLNRIISDQMLY